MLWKASLSNWCFSKDLSKVRKRQWHPTLVLLPGKSHGRRSLVGCSPWGREESDTTERLHFHFSLSCIGEGYGNPLQCSCLENPRDGGTWWAAIYGVAQSQTQLKQLSSKWSEQTIQICWGRAAQAEEQQLQRFFDRIVLGCQGQPVHMPSSSQVLHPFWEISPSSTPPITLCAQHPDLWVE